MKCRHGIYDASVCAACKSASSTKYMHGLLDLLTGDYNFQLRTFDLTHRKEMAVSGTRHDITDACTLGLGE